MIIYHKCSKNSKKITASYLDYHQFTVKISRHLHMQVVRYKNDKLTRA